MAPPPHFPGVYVRPSSGPPGVTQAWLHFPDACGNPTSSTCQKGSTPPPRASGAPFDAISRAAAVRRGRDRIFGIVTLSFVTSIRYACRLYLTLRNGTVGCMSEIVTAADPTTCHFPGCTEPSRPDPATGRKAKYCEQTIDGVLHNRANAWHHRRRQEPTSEPAAEVVAAPVSMARATLEDRLNRLPGLISEVREYMDGVLDELRAASDLEAAGAEVEDARREALAQTAAAEQRASAAERARREAEMRANEAAAQRDEADSAAEELVTELARQKSEFTEQITQLHAQTAADVERAMERAQAAEDARAQVEQEHAATQDALAASRAALTLAETNAEREQANGERLSGELAELRRELESAHLKTAASEASAAAAREAQKVADAATAEHRELARQAQAATEAVRAQTRADMDALRAETVERLQRERESANERVAAATSTVEALKATVAAYKTQLGGQESQDSSAPRKRATKRVAGETS